MNLLVIDNYDSFTYNLVQYFGELGADVRVKRNDQSTIEEIRKMRPDRICISPGPGRPENAGMSEEVVRELGKETPILGVCLGHQCIGRVFGGKIVRAERLMHGKTSLIQHGNTRRLSKHGAATGGDALSFSHCRAQLAARLPNDYR